MVRAVAPAVRNVSVLLSLVPRMAAAPKLLPLLTKALLTVDGTQVRIPLPLLVSTVNVAAAPGAAGHVIE